MSEVILKLPLITTNTGNLKEQCSTNKMGSKPKMGCHSRGVYEVLCLHRTEDSSGAVGTDHLANTLSPRAFLGAEIKGWRESPPRMNQQVFEAEIEKETLSHLAK